MAVMAELWPRQRQPTLSDRTIILLALIGGITAVAITAIVTIGGPATSKAVPPTRTHAAGTAGGASMAASRHALGGAAAAGRRGARLPTAHLGRGPNPTTSGTGVCCRPPGSTPRVTAPYRQAGGTLPTGLHRRGFVRSSRRHLHQHLLKRHLIRAHEG